jgi:hypothetical protein
MFEKKGGLVYATQRDGSQKQVFNMHVGLGTDHEERDFESFAVLDDGDIVLSET